MAHDALVVAARVGPEPSEGARLARRVSARLGLAMVAASIDGAVSVFVYLVFVLPQPPVADRSAWLHLNVSVFVGYLVLSVLVGTVWCLHASAPVVRWLSSGRPATAEDRRRVIKLPLDEAVISGVLWLGAAVLFSLLDLQFSTRHAVNNGVGIVLGGLSTTALCYLVAERITRPLVARALADEPSTDCGRLGVAPRMMLTWAFTTGIPLLAIGLAFVGRPASDAHRLVVPTFFLVGLGIAVGLAGTWFSTRSVAEPLAAIRGALDDVAVGRLDVRLAVDDGSEVGQLQAGFNRMAAGLRERQRLQDLFGRHVGTDVARRAMDRGVELGGESIDAAVLFVDLVDSTRLAASRPPDEVVDVLNRFFAVVVDTVTRHGGWVNKFEGDAALCVFGAPAPLDDAAECALAAARELHEAVVAVDGVRAAIGVTYGTVVAGNVGSRERYEYTVIGDPVNEAARLTELAKSQVGGVLASATTVARAGEPEATRWRLGEQVVLRGRDAPTVLATPAGQDGRLRDTG